jgi:pilus assembly protein CpaD
MRFSSTRLAASILPSTLLLAGCGGTLNRGIEPIHQPVVARTDYVLDVSAGPDGLSPGEQKRLGGWLDSLRVGYGDRVHVDDAGAGDMRIRSDVAQAASRYGILLADGAPVTPGPIAPGTARVIVSRTIATVPGCPDHSRNHQPNFGAHTSSDYGCGVNRNLAAMVAQPEDLVRGRSGDGIIDPLTATKPIQTLRDKKPTNDQPLEAVRTTQGGQ